MTCPPVRVIDEGPGVGRCGPAPRASPAKLRNRESAGSYSVEIELTIHLEIDRPQGRLAQQVGTIHRWCRLAGRFELSMSSVISRIGTTRSPSCAVAQPVRRLAHVMAAVKKNGLLPPDRLQSFTSLRPFLFSSFRPEPYEKKARGQVLQAAREARLTGTRATGLWGAPLLPPART